MLAGWAVALAEGSRAVVAMVVEASAVAGEVGVVMEEVVMVAE